MEEPKQRTLEQNRALHLWFGQLSEYLNEHGYTMTKVLKPGVDILWTDYNVKEYLWRPVQQVLFGKRSTKELNTNEIDDVLEIIIKHLGDQGIETVDFPSKELQLAIEEEYVANKVN